MSVFLCDQVCYKDSKAGRAYLIDCQTRNGGIPYADSFYVVLRYCLTRVSPSKCRVQVSSELKFCESVFFSGESKTVHSSSSESL